MPDLQTAAAAVVLAVIVGTPLAAAFARSDPPVLPTYTCDTVQVDEEAEKFLGQGNCRRSHGAPAEGRVRGPFLLTVRTGAPNRCSRGHVSTPAQVVAKGCKWV